MTYISPIDFDEELVPINYCWSGYVEDSAEFKNSNFLEVVHEGISFYICSAENGVALGEYLSKYIIADNCVRDLESVSSPGIDFWFYKVWERAEPDYVDLPEWVHKLVELFISEKLISRVNRSDNEFFAFSSLVSFEEQTLPSTIQTRVLNICRTYLMKLCDEHFLNYGSTEDLTAFDVSNWAATIINEFINNHPE